MSYCYDVMSRVWAEIQATLPADVRDSERVMRFGFLIEDMHEANHKLKDAINHDSRVTQSANKLDQSPALPKEPS